MILSSESPAKQLTWLPPPHSGEQPMAPGRFFPRPPVSCACRFGIGKRTFVGAERLFPRCAMPPQKKKQNKKTPPSPLPHILPPTTYPHLPPPPTYPHLPPPTPPTPYPPTAPSPAWYPSRRRGCHRRSGTPPPRRRRRRSWQSLPSSTSRLRRVDPTPPLDTRDVFGGLKTRLFEGPKLIGSVWVVKKEAKALGADASCVFLLSKPKDKDATEPIGWDRTPSAPKGLSQRWCFSCAGRLSVA